MSRDAHRRRCRALTRVSLERRRVLRWLLLPARGCCSPALARASARVASARLWPAQEYTRLILESPRAARAPAAHADEPDRARARPRRTSSSAASSRAADARAADDPYITAIRVGRQARRRAARRARPQDRGEAAALRAAAGRRIRPSPRARPLSADAARSADGAAREPSAQTDAPPTPIPRRAAAGAQPPRAAAPPRSTPRATAPPSAAREGAGATGSSSRSTRATAARIRARSAAAARYEKNVTLAIARQAARTLHRRRAATCARC